MLFLLGERVSGSVQQAGGSSAPSGGKSEGGVRRSGEKRFLCDNVFFFFVLVSVLIQKKCVYIYIILKVCAASSESGPDGETRTTHTDNQHLGRRQPTTKPSQALLLTYVQLIYSERRAQHHGLSGLTAWTTSRPIFRIADCGRSVCTVDDIHRGDRVGDSAGRVDCSGCFEHFFPDVDVVGDSV